MYVKSIILGSLRVIALILYFVDEISMDTSGIESICVGDQVGFTLNV